MFMIVNFEKLQTSPGFRLKFRKATKFQRISSKSLTVMEKIFEPLKIPKDPPGLNRVNVENATSGRIFLTKRRGTKINKGIKQRLHHRTAKYTSEQYVSEIETRQVAANVNRNCQTGTKNSECPKVLNNAVKF